MAQEYPLVFDATPTGAEISDLQLEPPAPVPWPWPWSKGPEVSIEVIPDAGQECHRFRLAEIRNWPEVKTTWELKCVTVFGKKSALKCLSFIIGRARNSRMSMYVILQGLLPM